VGRRYILNPTWGGRLLPPAALQCTMHAVAFADDSYQSCGDLLLRVGGTNRAFIGGRSASSQAMLRPFHSLEKQCGAERRVRMERCRETASKAGFLGQLKHLNFVQERLQSMRPSVEPGSEARLGVREDLSGDRWAMLPGSAPPPLLCRAAGPRPGVRGTTAGSMLGGLGSRQRRRPVHVIAIAEEDPTRFDFSEEPEDPRVYLPAHRIGDLLPEGASQSTETNPTLQPRPKPARRSAKPSASKCSKPGVSKSTPALHIAASRLPLRPLYGKAGGSMFADFGGARGAAQAKPMSMQQETAFDAFPAGPGAFQGGGEDEADEDMPD